MDAASHTKLQDCHIDIRRLFEEVDKYYLLKVTEGRRSPQRQDELFAAGKSKLKGDDPKAMHCHEPSDAVDVAPEPISWTNTKRFYNFAGFVLGVAAEMGIPIRWGGDWDGDEDLDDQSFNDLVHFERIL